MRGRIGEVARREPVIKAAPSALVGLGTFLENIVWADAKLE
jgi:hypothetical protein